MAKLLEVDLKVQLPKGSTYADVRVEFEGEGYYAASTTVGGDLVGKTTAPDANGMARVKGPDGQSPLMVYGGEVGDVMPPLVGLRIIPRGAGVRAMPWAHKGHPRDTGNDKWDGSKFGTAAGERISTEAERVSLAERIAAADAATGALAAQGAAVAQALADVTQNVELNNAATAANLGRKTASSVATIGAEAGLYNITSGADAGQVWERLAGAGTVRRPELEAVSQTQLQTVEQATGAIAAKFGDVATNTAALQSAVTALGTMGGRLNLGDYEHNLSSTITVSSYNLHLRGTSGADWVDDVATPTGTIITAVDAVTDLVRLVGAAGGAVGSYSFEGITFQGNAGITQTGVHSTIGNGPARPINFDHATFRKLLYGVKSDVPADQSTGLFNVNLNGTVYRGNGYALHGTGQGSYGNITALGTVLEQNILGGIKIEAHANGGLFGANIFGAMLLEGQVNPLELHSGLAQNVFLPNYFEQNTGHIKLTATRFDATQYVFPQYVHDSPALTASISGGRAYVLDETLAWRGRNTTFREYRPARFGLEPAAAPTLTMSAFSIESMADRAPPVFPYQVYPTAGAAEQTPLGYQRVEAINAPGAWIAPEVGLAPAYALVACAVMRAHDAGASIGANWIDQSGNGLASGAAQIPLERERWVVVVAVLSGVGAGVTPKIRWEPSGGFVRVGQTTVYPAAIVPAGGSVEPAAANGVPLYCAPGTVGTVTPQGNTADIAAAPTQADFNALLAKLRAAGILI